MSINQDWLEEGRLHSEVFKENTLAGVLYSCE